MQPAIGPHRNVRSFSSQALRLSAGADFLLSLAFQSPSTSGPGQGDAHQQDRLAIIHDSRVVILSDHRPRADPAQEGVGWRRAEGRVPVRGSGEPEIQRVFADQGEVDGRARGAKVVCAVVTHSKVSDRRTEGNDSCAETDTIAEG